MRYILSFFLGLLLIVGVAIPLHFFQKIEKEAELRERIGEMLLVGFRGTEVTEESPIATALKELHIGGVIVFDYDVPSASYPRNIVDPEQTRKLVADLKKYGGDDMFIAIDAEGGYVNRLKPKYGFLTVPSAQIIGERDEESFTRETYSGLARQLADLGFNLNFAPVVDVNVNPENPVIGYLERSFSDDPEVVARNATYAVEAYDQVGVLTALKHFPGHGSSADDSHLGLVDITETYEKERELLPYQRLIESDHARMIMTAHVMYRHADSELPATLSPIFLTEWLRGELGYTGVIVSDDMQMGAIVDHYGFEEALTLAVNAGVDMLILSNNGKEYDEHIASRAIDALTEAVLRGEISEERIFESSERIRTLKQTYLNH